MERLYVFHSTVLPLAAVASGLPPILSPLIQVLTRGRHTQQEENFYHKGAFVQFKLTSSAAATPLVFSTVLNKQSVLSVCHTKLSSR